MAALQYRNTAIHHGKGVRHSFQETMSWHHLSMECAPALLFQMLGKQLSRRACLHQSDPTQEGQQA